MGFLRKPLLEELEALPSLPASLTVARLPRLLTPTPFAPYPMTRTSAFELDELPRLWVW